MFKRVARPQSSQYSSTVHGENSQQATFPSSACNDSEHKYRYRRGMRNTLPDDSFGFNGGVEFEIDG